MEVKPTDRFDKEIEKFKHHNKEAILLKLYSKLRELENASYLRNVSNVKPLHGEGPDRFRIRIGYDHRIVVKYQNGIIIPYRFGKRNDSEVYK